MLAPNISRSLKSSYIAGSAERFARHTGNHQPYIDIAVSEIHEVLDIEGWLIDGLIDKELFESRKVAILSERRGLSDRLENPSSVLSPADMVSDFFERQNKAYLGYENGLVQEKRSIVEDVTSNFSLSQKNPVFVLKSPFQEITIWRELQEGGPRRGDVRTRATELLGILKSSAALAINDSTYERKRAA